MNYRLLGELALLLGLMGCGSVTPSQTPVAEPSQAVPPTSAPVSISKAEGTATSTIPESSPASSPIAPAPTLSPLAQAPSAPSTPRLVQDYAPTAPLPATGRVTMRGNIRDVSADRMIAQCPSDSAPYAFAESTNYVVQICSAEYDPWLPKYYMSRARDGSGGLELTNSNPNTARQLIFPNGDYTYILYRDSARQEQNNAYLQVQSPDGVVHAEALLYFYEQISRPTP